jgi:hypothetical protein
MNISQILHVWKTEVNCVRLMTVCYAPAVSSHLLTLTLLFCDKKDVQVRWKATALDLHIVAQTTSAVACHQILFFLVIEDHSHHRRRRNNFGL